MCTSKEILLFSALGLVALLTIISGCSLFQSQKVPMPPPQATCEEAPETFAPYMDLAQRVPAFGGMFFEHDNNILYVYLTDLSQEEALKQAIKELYGPRWLELLMYPQEIRVLQGQYSYLQLKAWHDCLSWWVLPIPGVTMTDIDDKQNRITIGIDMSLKAAKKRRVIEVLETAIERLSIPREAVILEEIPPVVPK
jgi:hypothetical protein